MHAVDRLRMTIGDAAFVGQLETKLAPHTCEFVLSILPLRRNVIHARWSGEALWVPLGDLALSLHGEALVQRPRPGQVLFYPGGVSQPEILIPYGSSAFACQDGPLLGTHFLTVDSDRHLLGEVGRQVLWSGSRPITFERS